MQGLESARRFKTLLPCINGAARSDVSQDDFAGTHAESFPLREMKHDVSLETFAVPTSLETSAVLETGRTCKSAAVCA
jgi:hypothetical protein